MVWRMAARIKTGATAWADRSLVASGWYPPHARSAEERLHYYASRFPLVENDAGYWALLGPEQVELWARRTPPGFTMNMKAHALLTGHYTDPRRLPEDIRTSLPRALREKARVCPRDLGPERMRDIGRRFREGLEPLRASGKLGLVLFQFPVWFPISRENKERLVRIREELAPCRVAVELRNFTWMSERNLDETLSLLASEGLVYTCVDEPQGFPSSVPPIAAATSDVAAVRMHGRNAARWQRGARTAAERFDYRYSLDELREWVPRILALAERTREVHVLMNNCHRDYAVRNAQEIAELLEAARREQVQEASTAP
jgi:uncharacterized protein YecE (DUF72 family)